MRARPRGCDLYRRLRAANRKIKKHRMKGIVAQQFKSKTVSKILHVFGAVLLLLLSPAVLACDINDLVVIDVSCSPPHGHGPDGRAWVQLVCSDEKLPIPYDWQLARLSGNLGDIFAWDRDPLYAYVEGEYGSYQACAHTTLGVPCVSLSLHAGGCSK